MSACALLASIGVAAGLSACGGGNSMVPQVSGQVLGSLFVDPERGNCASCHLVDKGAAGAHPTLSDYNFQTLGVPRNPEIPANADPKYYDLGLCGPMRTDKTDNKWYCGMFRTPRSRSRTRWRR
ncbi:hypothetical protein [Paraburkholderia youngii]|uniref:hypothetical protein n=1 Tax=Paraburkholderia youngii TaxID=2782701 RepID=UPI003D1BAF44